MKNALVFIPFLISYLAFSQETDPIVTDRPTQSAAVYTVGKGRFLIESGFLFQNITSFEDHLNSNTLFKYGVGDRIEVRLTMNYDRMEGDDFVVTGIGSTSLGTKVFLVGADDAFADISMIGQVNLPTGKQNDETTGEIRFNFQNQLSTRLSLGYNLGILLSPDSETEISSFYSIVLCAFIRDGWTFFVEPYGFFNAPSDHRFNAGVIYLVTPRFQVDLTSGLGLTDNSPDRFVGFGFAYGF